MATIRALIDRDGAWPPDTRLRLMAGTENAASLAASTPAGGAAVAEIPAWASLFDHGGLGAGGLGEFPLGLDAEVLGLGLGELGFGELGLRDEVRAVLERRIHPADVCCLLPIGILALDAAGNASLVTETVAEIADPPQGARGLAAAATANPGELALSWTESEDL